ncbi:MAG TPA: hypothetical protein VKB46_25895 [Pyrinomonadaceae bacterium]|nr:hypothetical protein [Pyrinomonadaceae bacterium]
MRLIEEKISRGGQRLGAIYMRDDGLFEGHLHSRRDLSEDHGSMVTRWSDDYEVCALTETLPRAEMIVDEELDL